MFSWAVQFSQLFTFHSVTFPTPVKVEKSSCQVGPGKEEADDATAPYMYVRVYMCVCVRALSYCSHVQLCNPMGCSPQAPLSMGFSRQEYWSGLPFPPLADLSNPGIKPESPALQDSLLLNHWGIPKIHMDLQLPFTCFYFLLHPNFLKFPNEFNS